MYTAKLFAALPLAALFFSACDVAKPTGGDYRLQGVNADTLITQSLFNDKAATLSEEAVQKILDGGFRLPQKARVAVVKLESPQLRRVYFWSDEEYLKTQQSYLDLFTQKLSASARVTKVSVVPDLLISKTPSFTQIREAAVRLQADLVVVYGIASDLYANYRLFGKNDLKAFATTQLIVMDVRTGLVPFSTVVTRDTLSQKKKDEVNEWEARSRIQHAAALLTINEIGNQLTAFLQKE